MKLYEYAVIWRPKAAKGEIAPAPTLLIGPKAILAANDQAVGMKAAREIGTEHDAHLEEIEVVIRPFS